MLDHLITAISTLPSWGIVLAAFTIAYIENVLPPSPSDVVLAFIGALVGMGAANFIATDLAATAGSVAGFYTMFSIGRALGPRFKESRLARFFPIDALDRAERWFQRWGYYVIVANRFLSGTRSVISLFAGMSQLEPLRTTLLCGISALVWNTGVLYAGMVLGQNWRVVGDFFHAYGRIITIALIALGVGLIARHLLLRKRQATE